MLRLEARRQIGAIDNEAIVINIDVLYCLDVEH